MYTLLFALLLCLVARPSGAVPVVAEARVRAAAGDVHGAARTATQRALVEAVRTVVRRHVSAADLSRHSRTVQRSVLDRAPRYVLRYSIADERWDDLAVVVRVEAEVDRARVLARLAEAGIPVAKLAVKPRLLLVALEPSAEGALGSLARTLEAAGYQPRIGARPAVLEAGSAAGVGSGDGEAAVAGVDEEQVGAWARTAGCHLALVVEAAAGEGATEREDALLLPTSWADDLWFDPGGPARAALPLVTWLVDPSGRLPLGRLEALGEGLGTDRTGADQAAGESAGRHLGYAALGLLEQSGWVPEGVPSVLDIRVSGLVDPLLVEEIGVALAAVPEVRRVQLVEVSRRRAVWRLQVVDAGLDWAAVLSTARLPRGQLEWGVASAAAPSEPATVPATPAAPAPTVLAARWLGP